MVFSIRQIGCAPDQLVDGPLQDKDIPLSYIFTSSKRGFIVTRIDSGNIGPVFFNRNTLLVRYHHIHF